MTDTVAGTRGTLKDLPGPKGVPMLGNLHQVDLKQLSGVLESWADLYGPCYRIRLGGRDSLVVADVDVANAMLRQRPDRYRRHNAIESVFDEMGISGVFSAEGDKWRRLRRLAMQSLNAEYLRQYFDTIARVTGRLRDRWLRAAAAGSDVDVHQDLMKYTVEVTAALSLGYDLDALVDDTDPLQARLKELFPMINRRINAPVPYWRLVKLPADRRVDKALVEINATVRDMIGAARTRHAARGGAPVDMLEAMLELDEFTDAEIVGNVITMLLAGQETTASTIAWMTHHVIEHPDVRARLRAEVDEVMAGDVATFAEVARLPYVKAVVNETMRVRPIAPIVFLEPTEDVVVGDVIVPKGTSVFVLTGHHAKLDEHFAHAAVFDPDRWLSPPETHDTKAFLPFGAGQRYCPGHNLAMLEATMAMAMIARTFDVSRPPGAAPVSARFAFTLQPVDLVVRLAAR